MKLLKTLPFLLMALPASAIDSDEVTEAIDQIIYDDLPTGTDIAIMVYDLTSDTTLYAYREKVLCRPASVLKVVTSATALASLGPDYTFDTTLRTKADVTADSVLTGDLYLVGGLDPALMEQDLKKMISDLKAAGINRIKGTLYADISIMDSVYWGSGWCWDDSPASFQPYISPLMVHEGYVGIQVRPTTKGQAPEVSLYPSNRLIRVINDARTQDNSLGPLTITRDWLHNDNTIIVQGNCKRKQSTDLSVVGTADLTFALFREYLDDAGIKYDRFSWGTCPVMAKTIAKVSHGLPMVMKEALKESNNLYAECMFLQTGRLRQPNGITFKEASKYIDSFVSRKFGMSSSEYNIVDGCGLSMYDFVSPKFMVDMLSLIYRDEKLFPLFYRSLPISGVDGTLKTRLNDKATLNKVHAKTGSVTGACTLAGYIRTADGRDLAFCIMNEGAVKMAPSRKIQDRICEVLCSLED